MKIISKFKDYYDYLSGVYGVDEKIILDRRDSQMIKATDIYSDRVVTLAICDHIIQGFCKKGTFFWGDEALKKVAIDKDSTLRYKNSKIPFIVKCSYGDYQYIEYPDFTLINGFYPNSKMKCPIMLSFYELKRMRDQDWIKNPRLESLQIAGILPAKAVYLLLTDWLSPVDKIQDNMTNEEKILARGFDLKTSFRGK